MSEWTLEWLEEDTVAVADIEDSDAFELMIDKEATAIELESNEFLEIEGAPGFFGGSTHQAFPQASSAATWTLIHNLGTKPPVMLFVNPDLSEPVFTDVTYPDLNTAVIEWPTPQTGVAYI